MKSIGQQVSHYKILGRLGAGGMGVVYEAQDLRLDRNVALKFLPPELSANELALERFRREAKAASTLNHPHICTIYAIEEDGGDWFIAMELLQGKSLDKLLSSEQLELDRLLDIGIQITDALDAAHSHGIVHRDIKPANIFVTAAGYAKVLDFGLAKMSVARRKELAFAGGESTVDPHLTSPGTAVGTIAYMSPEQARGRELDARSDLFSFGAVLYQMATGKIPFEGETSAVVYEAILNRDPVAPVYLNPDLPIRLEEIINHALEKDRELRFQSAAEVRSELKRVK